MADAAVVLTPIVVLGALLLLGFAGCRSILDIQDPVVSPSGLSFELRVPTALTVTEVVFRAVNPSGVQNAVALTNPVADVREEDEFLFRHRDGDLVPGGWSLTCEVTASDEGATAQDDGRADVIVEEPPHWATAGFRATGTPSGGDFTVGFAGLT
jgi:hypothetical protein